MIYYKLRFLILYFIIGVRYSKSNQGCFLYAMETLNRLDTLPIHYSILVHQNFPI